MPWGSTRAHLRTLAGRRPGPGICPEPPTAGSQLSAVWHHPLRAGLGGLHPGVEKAMNFTPDMSREEIFATQNMAMAAPSWRQRDPETFETCWALIWKRRHAALRS